jgi:integrase
MGVTKVGVTWYWRFQVNGKVRTGSCHTTNKTIALKYEAQKRKEIEDERVNGKRATTTIAEAMQTFLDTRQKSGEYDNIATLVNKTLGSKLDKQRNRVRVHGIDSSKELQNVAMSDIQRLIMARKTEGNSSQTILTELTYFKQAISLSGKLGFELPTIDFAALKRDNQLRPSKGRLRFLTVDEEVKLLVELDEDTQEFVIVLLDTGARYNEIAQLKWSAVEGQERVDHSDDGSRCRHHGQALQGACR